MRLPRLRFTIKGIMIMIAVLGVGFAAFALHLRNSKNYASGWWEAECELWREEATIYEFVGGYAMYPGDFCCIDRYMGLPIIRAGGCVVRAGVRERVHGHNDRIARYIRSHGRPKNTFKPWEKELFSLGYFFDDGSRTDVPRKLLADGPAAVSPNGKNSVRLVTGARNDGRPNDWLRVIITAGTAVIDNTDISPDRGENDVLWGPEMVPDKRVPVRATSDNGDYDLLWGPNGAPFVVIRSIFETREHFQAYDLRTGRLLRDEKWVDGKHYGG